MRYYFAGAYERRAELGSFAVQLRGAIPGAVVTSRWLIEDQAGEDAGFTAEWLTDPRTAARAWEYGERDVADLLNSDAIVSFTGGGTRGGRHIEHGFAMALRAHGRLDGQQAPTRLIVVGPREHVFHCHPATEHFHGFAGFLAHEIKRYREETR